MWRELYARRSDYLPTATFFGFVVVGVLYIITSKSLQFPGGLVTGVPVTLMAAYAVVIWVFRRARLRDDQTGDNFYYMGFIFTLTSLAVALIQYSFGSGVDQIVQNFGIAVATTIAGIVFRILFNLARRDPVEIEHLSRLELSEASNKVRRELNTSLVDFAHFRRANQQMLEEGYEEIASRFSQAADSALESLDKVSKAAQESVEQSSQYEAREVIAEELMRTQTLLKAINDNLEKVDTHTARIAEQLRRRSEQKGALLRLWDWMRGAS